MALAYNREMLTGISSSPYSHFSTMKFVEEGQNPIFHSEFCNMTFHPFKFEKSNLPPVIHFCYV